MKLRSRWFSGVALLAIVHVGVCRAESSCERLKASLTYTQEEAPRDLSSVLPVVVEKVNRVLDGVVDVQVEWTGADLHGRVGEHIVECTVTRLASAVASETYHVEEDDEGRKVTRQCFHVPFTIMDTNECGLPFKHPMRHQCSSSALCVNTIGSYECLCPRLDSTDETILAGTTVQDAFWEDLATQTNRSPWELSFASSSKTSCPSTPSTHDCCPASSLSAEGLKCRKRFRCPIDPCKANNCAANARCLRKEHPDILPDHTCLCPEGLMGNGHACKPDDPKPQPKVQHDGVTPTEQTVKNNFYCGCTKPVIDACSGFPPCKGKHEICVAEGNEPTCACKPGYVLHEEYGCVDQHAPTLKLRHDPHGDQTLRLKQGDVYKEHMVDIMDENAEDYLRSLKISYSQPLPPGCLTQVGEFHVNYTVAMPWATPPYVRITRRVVIDDIDECQLDVSKYQHSCPPLVPQCDKAAGAKCINTIGSYACQCPSQSKGDGFLKTASFGEYPAPDSYQGGTSCVDTSKPIITLQGPNPKVFRICECGGLSGVMSNSKSNAQDNTDLQSGQRQLYEQDIKEMIRATAGAELCATHQNPHPRPNTCARAIDHTYEGVVDLSDRVVIGDPVPKSPLEWSVPYNVKDDAGNEAVTVYRDVVVEEVDLNSVEIKIREEVLKEQEDLKQRAIERAVQEEKAKWESEQATKAAAASRQQRRTPGGKQCPDCPPCDCQGAKVGRESCEAYCDNLSKTCALSDDSFMYFLVFYMEDYISPSLIPGILMFVLALVGLLILRGCANVMFNPRGYRGYDYDNFASGMDDAILQSPMPQQVPQQSPAPPPRTSLSTGNNGFSGSNNSFFSPSNQSVASTNNFGSQTPATRGSINRDELLDDSIYASPPLITPSKTGDGVRTRRRGPYT